MTFTKAETRVTFTSNEIDILNEAIDIISELIKPQGNDKVKVEIIKISDKGVDLKLLEKVEEKWFPAEAYKTIQLVYEEDSISLDKIKIIIEANRFVVKDVNLSKVMSDKRVILRYRVRSPREADIVKLSEALKQTGKLSEFSITD